MFTSFFPRPKAFLISAIIWAGLVVAFWHLVGATVVVRLGLAPTTASSQQPDVSFFWSAAFIWLCLYWAVAAAVFAMFWQLIAPHRWWAWSILGTATLIFCAYLQVQIGVVINTWLGSFYNTVQEALTPAHHVGAARLYDQMAQYGLIALIYAVVSAFTAFITSHYVFRWRIAMNGFYLDHWSQLRRIEGAAQRIQEDTMRFCTTLETLGINLINAVMTLIVFLPVLSGLSAQVHTLPLFGEVPHALVIAALAWSLFGTLFLTLLGIKLPGIQFANQRVEATYRKELVRGEDDPDRAQPQITRFLFDNVRKSYYYLYFHYTYFNGGRFLFTVMDSVFAFFTVVPTIVAGAITFGVLVQIINVFGQVRISFQYLVMSAPVIVELLSIYKRLRAFEATLAHRQQSAIEFTTSPTGV